MGMVSFPFPSFNINALLKQSLRSVCCDSGGRWPLEGITADELARFLEIRLRRPVVNFTSLKGRWSIHLSPKAGKTRPSRQNKLELDELGLELAWEKAKILVTVVKDKATAQNQRQRSD
jgi:uncharacterized protein (TIGR03435 family)